MLKAGSIARAQIPVAPTPVYCKIHKDEEIRLFCKNCNDLVCSECVAGQHVGHIFLSLKDKAGKTRENLPRIIENLKSNTIPKVRETLKKITQALNEHSENGTTVVNGINGQADKFIKEINKVRNKLIQEEEIRQSTDRKKLKEFKKKTEEVLSHAEGLVTDCPDKIKTANDSSITTLGLDLHKDIPEIEKQVLEKIPSFEHRIFVPGRGSTESIRHLLGQCVDKKPSQTDGYSKTLEQKSNKVTLPKLEIHSEFNVHTFKGRTLAIVTQENHTAWIATHYGDKIKHVKTSGQVNNTLTFNTNIWDIAVTDDGCLLATQNAGYCIMKVKPNGDIVTFLNVKPLMPRGICITKIGHIYVGCIDSLSYDITERNTRPVMKFSNTGVVQQRYQYDNKHRMLFTAPLKIEENINGDLWILDRTARHAGRVVVIQQDGELRFLYTGAKCDQLTKQFYPCGLAAVGDGTMLITDTKNDILHVVDKNGTLLRFLGSEQVVYPSSISLDTKNNQLWIGSKNGLVQIFDFK